MNNLILRRCVFAIQMELSPIDTNPNAVYQRVIKEITADAHVEPKKERRRKVRRYNT